MSKIETVGFLGLGIMGSRMARNLAQKGFKVVAWNRTPSKVAELAGVQVAAAQTPRELADRVDAFCTCVADPQALRDVSLGENGLLAGARNGQLFIDFSTVSPSLTTELERAFHSRGVDFVEAPVTGSKSGAENGTLVVMAGGSEHAVQRAMPVFLAVGQKVIHCGPMGHGSTVKLAGNALIASMLQGLSEGLMLCQKAEVSPQRFLEVVQASAYRSPYYEAKGAAILNRNFDTQFAIDLMFKDLSLFLEQAGHLRLPTPLTATLRELYQMARANGKGELDIAAVSSALESLAVKARE